MSHRLHSSLYFGRVMHRRLRPFMHKFVYRVFTMHIDLDELTDLDRRVRVFSHNRWNLFSFHTKDHGLRDGSDLKTWAASRLRAQGINQALGRVSVLCYPRVLGYVFNPLSLWLCSDNDGHLLAIIYEVRNTFGGHHAYVLKIDPSMSVGATLRQSCRKRFYVSPFIEPTGAYKFKVQPPADAMMTQIVESDEDGPLLIAMQNGTRREFTTPRLLQAFCLYPLMTLKVIAAIHWQALKLWSKGAPYFAYRIYGRSAAHPRSDTAAELPNRR
jgi:DUF1365 family protein